MTVKFNKRECIAINIIRANAKQCLIVIIVQYGTQILLLKATIAKIIYKI